MLSHSVPRGLTIFVLFEMFEYLAVQIQNSKITGHLFGLDKMFIVKFRQLYINRFI